MPIDGKPLSEKYDVLPCNAGRSSHVIYLFDHRFFTKNENTSELVNIERPDQQTLTWSAQLKDGNRRRTTVVVTSQGW